MNKDKELDELNKELQEWLEDDPFGLEEEIETILFRCVCCGEEDEVPEYVVEEFQIGLEPNEEVETVCPKCGSTMHRARKSPK